MRAREEGMGPGFWGGGMVEGPGKEFRWDCHLPRAPEAGQGMAGLYVRKPGVQASDGCEGTGQEVNDCDRGTPVWKRE